MAHLSDANVPASVPAEQYPYGGRESMDSMLREADDRAEYDAWLAAQEAEYEAWLDETEAGWDEISAQEAEMAYDDEMSDVEADADTLASAGYGTDEDYGYYGGDEYDW